MFMDRYDFMREALSLAEIAYQNKEIPVGCVVTKNGKIISRGYNRTIEKNNVICHAEIEAIQDACKTLASTNLSDCELYVTLEPCPMCAGAIINAKISKVVFGAFDLNYGACGSATNLFSLSKIHRPECYGGIMEDACSKILSDFFREIRDKNQTES